MKNLICCITLLCLALMQTTCHANKSASTLHDNEDEAFVFSHPYVYPYYLNGGDQGLQSDFYSALSKTATQTQDCVQGRAVVSFTVSKDGTIKPNSIKIIRNRSVPDDYMNAAIEAIKGLGKFEPGKMNGEPKNVTIAFPVVYPIPVDRIKVGE